MREKMRGRTAGTQREMERWRLSKRRERGEGGDETERKGKREEKERDMIFGTNCALTVNL